MPQDLCPLGSRVPHPGDSKASSNEPLLDRSFQERIHAGGRAHKTKCLKNVKFWNLILLKTSENHVLQEVCIRTWDWTGVGWSVQVRNGGRNLVTSD